MKTFISVYNEMKLKSARLKKQLITVINSVQLLNSLKPSIQSVIGKSLEPFFRPGRSAYTKIMKYNSLSIKPDFVSPVCSITPVGIGYKIEAFDFNINDAAIKIKIDRAFGQNLLPPYNAHFVVFLSDPLNPELHNYITFVNTSTFIDAGISYRISDYYRSFHRFKF